MPRSPSHGDAFLEVGRFPPRVTTFDRVLLTSIPVADQPLARRFLPDATITDEPISASLAAAHTDTEVLCVMIHDRLDAEALAALPALRGVVTRSTGFDHLPIIELEKRGVYVGNLGEYAASGVAHLTVAFILAMLRRIPEAVSVTTPCQGKPSWDRSTLEGRHLHDVTIGVLGTGRIGRRVVHDLTALGATVVGYDIVEDDELKQRPGFHYAPDLATLLRQSDVLTLHVPHTPKTDRMISENELALLPRGAAIVNTARGGIVETSAVVQALQRGHLSGFAADVLAGEPNPPDLSTLQHDDRILLTPHLGAYDGRSIRERYRHVALAVQAMLQDDDAALEPYRIAGQGQ